MQEFETVADALVVGRTLLADIGIETAALDARLLLGQATGLEPATLIISPDYRLNPKERNLFIDYMVRRAEGEPVSRILGTREFYGREFEISRFVLDPRPDTESVINLILDRHKTETTRRVVDLGSGSGAIILTLLAERPKWTGLAIDVSRHAVEMTSINADKLAVASRVVIAVGSWLDGCEEKFDLIVSNPPYIQHRDIAGLSREVREHDPHLALDGGRDGLDCYWAIAAQSGGHLAAGGEVVVEIGAGQQADVMAIFEACGFALVDQHNDLGGHVRALAFTVSTTPL